MQTIVVRVKHPIGTIQYVRSINTRVCAMVPAHRHNLFVLLHDICVGWPTTTVASPAQTERYKLLLRNLSRARLPSILFIGVASLKVVCTFCNTLRCTYQHRGFMKRISVATSTRNPYNLWNRNIDKYKNDTYGSRSVRLLIYEQNCAIENAFLKYHRNEKNRTQRFTHSTRINDKNFFIF